MMRGIDLYALAAGLVVLTGAPAFAAQDSAVVLAQASANVTTVKTATLSAIADVRSGASVQDFEGAILFAIDRLKIPYDQEDAGLAAAANTLPDGASKTAIANIRAMRHRVAGTRGVLPGSANLLLGPSIGGGGGGGTSNYGR